MHRPRLLLLAAFFSTGCPEDDPPDPCPAGTELCLCQEMGVCESGLVCNEPANTCVAAGCVDGSENCPCYEGVCGGPVMCEGGVCGGSPVAGTAGSATATDTDPDTGTPPGEGLRLFAATAQPGNFAATATGQTRTVVDAFCESDSNTPTGCEETTAVISIGPGDTIIELGIPMNREVFGPDGLSTIAPSFADMLTGGTDLLITLRDAGVAGPYAGNAFWSGASAGGGVGFNCAGWVDGGEETGIVGTLDSTGSGWFSGSPEICEQTQALILCACF